MIITKRIERMNTTKRIYRIVFTLLILIQSSFAFAQDVQNPKYAADVPAFLLTRTRWRPIFLGILSFSMGCPVNRRSRKPMTFSTYREACRRFWTECRQLPFYAFLEGLKDAGLKPGDLGMTESLLDARGLLLTAQSTTPYAFTEIDLKEWPGCRRDPRTCPGHS